jgi:hypothetical protein
LKWAFTYHLGSIALGSLLVAIITLIKIVFEYLAKQNEKIMGKDNFIFKAVVCCLRCVIWCLDCCIKYINLNAYIQIAIHGSNFCTSAKEAFYLIVRHADRFGSVNLISTLLTFLGKALITGLSVWISMLWMNAKYPQVQ